MRPSPPDHPSGGAAFHPCCATSFRRCCQPTRGCGSRPCSAPARCARPAAFAAAHRPPNPMAATEKPSPRRPFAASAQAPGRYTSAARRPYSPVASVCSRQLSLSILSAATRRHPVGPLRSDIAKPVRAAARRQFALPNGRRVAVVPAPSAQHPARARARVLCCTPRCLRGLGRWRGGNFAAVHQHERRCRSNRRALGHSPCRRRQPCRSTICPTPEDICSRRAHARRFAAGAATASAVWPTVARTHGPAGKRCDYSRRLG